MHDLTATLSHSDHNLFRSDVVEGLSRRQKTIPCRWLYDERGGDLLEEITRLEDYYPTRAEIAILRARQLELRQVAGPGPILIEYGGCGSEDRTRAGLHRRRARAPASNGAPDGTTLSLSVSAARGTRGQILLYNKPLSARAQGFGSDAAALART
ncbi:L-histidine N(alpha)-methyltransferase, partial [Mesorhizobium sp. M0166]|uniref:L-histidine N(alpha)-methyltransferase n=1 Tax=Mesorhizobium sp. M0166 TaxID=2956902 RepID=UPI003339561D